MLPRFQPLLLALVMALLVVLGTLGMYTAEASTFRAAIRDAQSYETAMPTHAYDLRSDDPMQTSMPGMSY